MVVDLRHAGLNEAENVLSNLSASSLTEHAIKREEGCLSSKGALVIRTGKYTGRSPNDKFIVQDETTEKSVWWGKINKPISPDVCHRLRQRMLDYLKTCDLFVQDSFAGASPKHRLRVRVITERAWHALFAKNMFIDPAKADLADFVPEFTVIHAPGFKADPARDGTNSEAAIIVDFSQKQVLICGTEYAGEIKKSIFSVLNYLLPAKNILGMHCSANIGCDNDVSIFFGLSGTGKTTLSADPLRQLIGDDEHGWNDEGVFNFEGGCYAKVIRLSPKDEPEIFKTTQTFGTILENVVVHPETRELDLQDDRYTENSRASYPISEISNAYMPGLGDHPKHIVMLTCDAFGVLPPLAKLTPEQAMYHFISGYTAKVAGTERGITEPAAVFSACFGAPFMPRHPHIYAKILGEKIAHHQVDCWLVNTGWTGGPYGVGNRMKISWTRTLISAALSGALKNTKFVDHPYFKVGMPTEVAGVPSDILDPRRAWPDVQAYDEQAKRLVQLFQANFKEYEQDVSADILSAQPGF